METTQAQQKALDDALVAPDNPNTLIFQETHSKIDEILHEVVPQIAKNAINDLIEYNLKPCIANTIIEDRDAFRSEVPALVSQEFNAHTPAIIEELFKNRANDIVLQEALRRKFEKSSPSITSCMENDFHSQHDEHQEDDAPPEGEKRVKRKDNVIDEDEVIPKDETPELIAEFHNIDKRVPTIFVHARMEATLRDTLSNQYRNIEEYAYHLEQSTNFMENQIVWESRQQDIPRIVPKTPIFYGPQRNPNEPPRCCVIWEKVCDFQLGIKSYQIKVNLTAPTLTFSGIEEHAPYSILDEPNTGLNYLNNEDKKRLMYLVEIVKFYDATLEKVLKGVKLRMFESKFFKKLKMLGDLDQDIMKAYEREISMRLSH
ncbi:hypothetical protein Tco_1123246 [Tanacetum coccineum]|uniref:Uncharacterized protein n=1 Tax=Tanacetum coccineum TaxID=301880 RepID=A0ABQ5J3V5_9ASTR